MNLLRKMILNKLKKKARRYYEIRQEQQPGNPNIAAEIKLHYKLAALYEKHQYDKDVPHAEIYALECYRLAAILGDAKAQFICGKKLLDKGRFWENMTQSIYACQAHSKYAYEFYKEGLTYLESAEQNGFAPAKRLRGLAFINGWGLPKDYDLGFNLIVASIEAENAWDKAKEILTDLGLNAAEFFTKLAAKQKQLS